MAKRKGTQGLTMIYKTLQRKIKIQEHETHKETKRTQRYSERVSSSCSTSVTLVKKTGDNS